MARWPGGQVARWPGGQVARWPGGQVARWPGGQARQPSRLTKPGGMVAIRPISLRRLSDSLTQTFREIPYGHEGIPPLKVMLCLRQPSEIQNLGTEIGRMGAGPLPKSEYIYIYIYM